MSLFWIGLMLAGALFSFWPMLLGLVLLYFIDARTVGLWQRFRYTRHRKKELRRLERRLTRQPQDMDARTKLADIFLERRKYERAIEIVKPVVAGGDHSPATLLLLGRACTGAKKYEVAETLLSEAKEEDPRFRQGVLDLALGELHLASGAHARAVTALEAYCAGSPGSVEGHLLLAKARARAGDQVGAKTARAQAFANFRVAPAFVRKRDRLLIWRLQPWRPFVFVPLTVFGAFTVPIGGYLLFSFGGDYLLARQMKVDPIGTPVALGPAPKPLDQHLTSFDVTAEGVSEKDLRQVNFVIANVFGQFGNASPPLLAVTNGLPRGHCDAKNDNSASTALRALEFVSLLCPTATLTITRPNGPPVTLKQGVWSGDSTLQRLMAQYGAQQTSLSSYLVSQASFAFAVEPPAGTSGAIAKELSDYFVRASQEGLLPGSLSTLWIGEQEGVVTIETENSENLTSIAAMLTLARRKLCAGDHCLRPNRLYNAPSLMKRQLRELMRDTKNTESPLSSWLSLEAGLIAQSRMGERPAPGKSPSLVVGRWPELTNLLRGDRLVWRNLGNAGLMANPMVRRQMVTSEWSRGTTFLVQPDGTILENELSDDWQRLTLHWDKDKTSVVRRGQPGAIALTPKGRLMELLGEYDDGIVVEEGVQNFLPPSTDLTIAIYGTEGLRYRSETFRRSMMTSADSFRWGKDRVVIPSEAGEVAVLSLLDRSVKRYKFGPSSGGTHWVHEAGENRLVALLSPNLMSFGADPTDAQSPIVALDIATGRTVRHNLAAGVLRNPIAIIGDEVWLAHSDEPGVGAFSTATGEWHSSATSAALPPGAKIMWAIQEEGGHVVVGTEKDGVRALNGNTSWLVYQPTENEQTAASVSPTGGVALVVWTNARSRLILAREDGARAEIELPLGPVSPVWIGADEHYGMTAPP